MKRKMTEYVLFSVLLVTNLNRYSYGLEKNEIQNNKIQEHPIKAEYVLAIGSDKDHEDFYLPKSFDVDRDGNIYILDSGNSRVQVFSSTGQFLYGFGKAGQGPGELSSGGKTKTGATKIKILEDGNIYIVDNGSHRINEYDKKGQFIKMGKLSLTFYDDILLFQGKYYLTSLYLKENYAPIYESRVLGEIEYSFGIFIEPSRGLVSDMKSKLKYPEGLQMYFAGGNWAFISRNSENEIIYSQRLPYRIVKYHPDGHVLRDVVGNVEFDTQNRFELFVDGRWAGISRNSPSPSFFAPKMNSDDSLMVPYMNPENDVLFIDKYDCNLELTTRYKTPLKIIDDNKGNRIRQVVMDDDHYIYFLVLYEEKSPQLLKYKLTY